MVNLACCCRMRLVIRAHWTFDCTPHLSDVSESFRMLSEFVRKRLTVSERKFSFTNDHVISGIIADVHSGMKIAIKRPRGQ